MPAGATYEPIATTTVSGSNSSSVTFSSLGSYTDIIAIISVIGATDYASLYLRFNSDTGSNYSSTSVYGSGASASSGRDTSAVRMRIGWPYQGTGTDDISFSKVHIFSYAGSTNKTVLAEGANDQNGAGDVDRFVGLWRSTSAITSVTFDTAGSTAFKIGSTFSLYGIKAA